ncbi:MAG: hypothetical protein AAGI68_11285 [Planctomycetota bacterium]
MISPPDLPHTDAHPNPAENSATDQALPVQAVLDLAVPLTHVRSLLSPSQRLVFEPMQRGRWGVITLAVRWAEQGGDETPAERAGEVWAAGVRGRVVSDRLDLIDAHTPLDLAPPNAAIRITPPQTHEPRLFPLTDAAERRLPLPVHALTTDQEGQSPHRLHALAFEPLAGGHDRSGSTVEFVGVQDEQGGLDWITPDRPEAPLTGWLRRLGSGVWRGEAGIAIRPLHGGALGGVLWGPDARQDRTDPQPLVPPIAQQAAAAAESPQRIDVAPASRVLAAS